MEAIRAATYWPSLMMGVSDDVGTLAEGKVADIIACAATYSATRASFRISTSSSTGVAA